MKKERLLVLLPAAMLLLSCGSGDPVISSSSAPSSFPSVPSSEPSSSSERWTPEEKASYTNLRNAVLTQKEEPSFTIVNTDIVDLRPDLDIDKAVELGYGSIKIAALQSAMSQLKTTIKYKIYDGYDATKEEGYALTYQYSKDAYQPSDMQWVKKGDEYLRYESSDDGDFVYKTDNRSAKHLYGVSELSLFKPFVDNDNLDDFITDGSMFGDYDISLEGADVSFIDKGTYSSMVLSTSSASQTIEALGYEIEASGNVVATINYKSSGITDIVVASEISAKITLELGELGLVPLKVGASIDMKIDLNEYDSTKMEFDASSYKGTGSGNSIEWDKQTMSYSLNGHTADSKKETILTAVDTSSTFENINISALTYDDPWDGTTSANEYPSWSETLIGTATPKENYGLVTSIIMANEAANLSWTEFKAYAAGDTYTVTNPNEDAVPDRILLGEAEVHVGDTFTIENGRTYSLKYIYDIK